MSSRVYGFHLATFICLVLFFCPAAAPAVELCKTVAITIDDVPGPGPLEKMQKVNEQITSKLQKAKIPVTGFVNECFLYKLGELDANITCLDLWPARGMDLGNHTYSHKAFKDMSLLDFEIDTVQGETITRLLLNRVNKELKYFRFPYLDSGSTPEIKKQFEEFLSQRHYTIAPVSLGIDDWNFNATYEKALADKNATLAEETVRDYLAKTEKEILDQEAKNERNLHRQFPLIFLCHCLPLNADHMDELVSIFEKHGYKFVSLSNALNDEVYHRVDRVSGDEGWKWSASEANIENK